MENKNSNLRYKWVIFFVCGLMVFTVLGFCSSSNSMYTVPITEALGISRSSYSLSTSVRFITTAVVNAFFGSLIYRFGAKKLIIAGFISLIISTFIYSVAESFILFCVGSFFLGVGLSFTTTSMVGVVINKWCAKSKGTVLGVIMAANGVGAAVARMIMTPIINSDGDPFGYRNAYRLIIVILFAVGLLLLILFKDSPNGERFEIKKKRSEPETNENKIFRTPYFYVSLICVFITGLILHSISSIADPHFRDNNLDIALITVIMSFKSIILSASKFITGFIYDKAGIRITSGICYIAGIVTMVALALVGMSAGVAFAFIYAVFSTIALPLETIMLPIFAREIFGEKSFEKALGIYVSVNTAGYAIGGPLSNLVFDITGSYNAWIIIGAVFMAIVFISMNFVLRSSRRESYKGTMSLENGDRK